MVVRICLYLLWYSFRVLFKLGYQFLPFFSNQLPVYVLVLRFTYVSYLWVLRGQFSIFSISIMSFCFVRSFWIFLFLFVHFVLSVLKSTVALETFRNFDVSQILKDYRQRHKPSSLSGCRNCRYWAIQSTAYMNLLICSRRSQIQLSQTTLLTVKH